MSKTVPELFKAAHRLRKHLRELQAEIDQGPRVMKAQEQHLAAEEQLQKDAHAAIGRLKLKIREDEVSLKATNTQLAKFEKQLDDAGSTKEYDAKQSEIRMAKEKIAGLEEAILLAMEMVERQTAELPAVEQRWAEAQNEFAQFQLDAQERLDRMIEDQKRTQEELAEVDAQFPAEVKPLYDRLVARYGADGLAGLTGRTCQQCRTSVTEQQRIMIQGGKYFCCPNCGRGLYIAV
jgi:predicted  nucleic acid-binding Zn-ribbon protein